MKHGVPRTGRISVCFSDNTLRILSRHAETAGWSIAWSIRQAIREEAALDGVCLPEIEHRIPRYRTTGGVATSRVLRIQVEYVESWARLCEATAISDGWASVAAWWSMLLARWAVRQATASDDVPSTPVRERRGRRRRRSLSSTEPEPVPELTRGERFRAECRSMSRWPEGRAVVRGHITGWPYVSAVSP